MVDEVIPEAVPDEPALAAAGIAGVRWINQAAPGVVNNLVFGIGEVPEAVVLEEPFPVAPPAPANPEGLAEAAERVRQLLAQEEERRHRRELEQQAAAEAARPVIRQNRQRVQFNMPERQEAHPDRGVRLILRGEKVTLVSSEVMGEMSFEAFAKDYLHDNPAQFSEPLPAGTRFVQSTAEAVKLLIEMEPTLLTVSVAGKPQRYTIATPWQYFFFHFNRAKANKDGIKWTFKDARVYWRRSRLKNIHTPGEGGRDYLGDYLWIAKLPNIYNDGRICFGNTAPDSTLSLADRIEAIVNEFFEEGSAFNGDLGWNFPGGYRSFPEWAKASKADPFCYLQWRDFEMGRAMLAVSHHFPLTGNNSESMATLADRFRRNSGGAF